MRVKTRVFVTKRTEGDKFASFERVCVSYWKQDICMYLKIEIQWKTNEFDCNLPDFPRKEPSKAYYLIIKSLSFAHQKPIICQSKNRLLPKNCRFSHFENVILCYSAVPFFQIAKCRCWINLPTIAFVPPKDFIAICLY